MKTLLIGNRYNIHPFLIIFTLSACILPSICNLFGIYFGLSNVFVDFENVRILNELEANEALHPLLASKFAHTMLVSFSISIAFLTIILAFVDYFIKRNVSTPIVGVALFCAGILDVIHIMIADQIIQLNINNSDITSFTWLFSRTFHALILILGVGIFLVQKKESLNSEYKSEKYFVFFISIIFILLAVNSILILTDGNLKVPTMSFPNSLIPHPYDLIPLFIYVIALIYIFPEFYRQNPSTFSQTLILSIFPSIVSELHMAFGSKIIFDNHFFIAHFLKNVAYFVPFLGLSLNYLETYRNERAMIEALDEEIREKEKTKQILRGVLDGSLNGIMVLRSIRDQDGEIIDFEWTLVNPAATKLTPYKREDLIGNRFLSIVSLPGRQTLFERYKKVVETGKPVIFEQYIESYKMNYAISAVKLGDGITVTFDDITDKKNAQEALLNYEKVSATGKFARTIAHEIRNPLTNINLAVEELKSTFNSESDESIYIDILFRNSNRINQLISELLNTARTGEYEFTEITINEAIEDSLKLAEDRIKLKNIRIERSYSEPCPLLIDKDKMIIALLNIFINAIEAMGDHDGLLSIKTRHEADKCIVEISDNGYGITKENLKKMFEPYFSSKPKGIGLGLTSTQQIIFNHHGTIKVESEVNKGTTFTVTLFKNRREEEPII